ncbi:MAG: GNAT family N-acetyltransferase [Dehalococcoidales bacterium]|nr:GNAT family N-acetyltransferase [Dehalococcoidales bacterium]
MEIEIRYIDEQTVKDLFPTCDSCLYWEAPEMYGKDKTGRPQIPPDEAIEIKQRWFRKMEEKFGNCGQILYVDGKAVGYVQYAPHRFLPNVAEFSRELFAPSPDGVLVSCIHIREGYQGQGLGGRLLQAAIGDLRSRGYQAVETYSRDDSASNSSGPTVLYLEHAFRQISRKRRGEAAFSLMRLELS